MGTLLGNDILQKTLIKFLCLTLHQCVKIIRKTFQNFWWIQAEYHDWINKKKGSEFFLFNLQNFFSVSTTAFINYYEHIRFYDPWIHFTNIDRDICIFTESLNIRTAVINRVEEVTFSIFYRFIEKYWNSAFSIINELTIKMQSYWSKILGLILNDDIILKSGIVSEISKLTTNLFLLFIVEGLVTMQRFYY